MRNELRNAKRVSAGRVFSARVCRPVAVITVIQRFERKITGRVFVRGIKGRAERKIESGEEKRRLSRSERATWKISWPHILERSGDRRAHISRWYMRADKGGMKGLPGNYEGTNENRASRKTARYGGLKCSHSAYAELINDRRAGEIINSSR